MSIAEQNRDGFARGQCTPTVREAEALPSVT